MRQATKGDSTSMGYLKPLEAAWYVLNEDLDLRGKGGG